MTKEEQLARLQVENLALRAILTTVVLGMASGKNPTEYIPTTQVLTHIADSHVKGREESEAIFPNGGEIFTELRRSISEEFLAPLSLSVDD